MVCIIAIEGVIHDMYTELTNKIIPLVRSLNNFGINVSMIMLVF